MEKIEKKIRKKIGKNEKIDGIFEGNFKEIDVVVDIIKMNKMKKLKIIGK